MTRSDERSRALLVGSDFGRWVITYPVKVPATLLLDVFGVQPWKNMLRRTRTMFERESEFIPMLEFEDAEGLNKYLGYPPDNAVPFLDKLNYTGRKGAMWHFGNYLASGRAGWAPEERQNHDNRTFDGRDCRVRTIAAFSCAPCG